MQENSVVTAGASDDGEYLSRSTEHLANMASQLADLIGYPVLAYELIQNADDGGAELLSVRVLEDRREPGAPYWSRSRPAAVPVTAAGLAGDGPDGDGRVDLRLDGQGGGGRGRNATASRSPGGRPGPAASGRGCADRSGTTRRNPG